jgi:hypothetical protein
MNITAYNWKAREHKHVAVKELKDSEGKQKKGREKENYFFFLEAIQSELVVLKMSCSNFKSHFKGCGSLTIQENLKKTWMPILRPVI